MSAKRILIFIDWFLPGYKAGGPISSNANLVDHLSGEYEFYIITRNTDYCETIPYPDVNTDAWNRLPSGAHVYYISSKQLSFKTLRKITKLIDFELVYINGIYSIYFSLFPLIWFKYFHRNNVVVSARGMLSDHTFSSKRIKKKLFYLLAKISGLYNGIILHATNEEEAVQIRKNVGFKGTIKVAPNLPPKTIFQVPALKSKKQGALRLVSIARISSEKNTLFALQALCHLNVFLEQLTIHSTLNITFDLYGTIYDPAYWKLCEETIVRLPSNIRVNYCGPLEKSKIQETLLKYHFLLMPSQGENYGHSIIESLLAGCPVIISNRTPWRGLEKIMNGNQIHANRQPSFNLGVGWDLPLEQPAMFVDALYTCLTMSEDIYNEMSRRSYDYAQEITKDQKVVEANRRLFE